MENKLSFINLIGILLIASNNGFIIFKYEKAYVLNQRIQVRNDDVLYLSYASSTKNCSKPRNLIRTAVYIKNETHAYKLVVFDSSRRRIFIGLVLNKYFNYIDKNKIVLKNIDKFFDGMSIYVNVTYNCNKFYRNAANYIIAQNITENNNNNTPPINGTTYNNTNMPKMGYEIFQEGISLPILLERQPKLNCILTRNSLFLYYINCNVESKTDVKLYIEYSCLSDISYTVTCEIMETLKKDKKECHIRLTSNKEMIDSLIKIKAMSGELCETKIVPRRLPLESNFILKLTSQDTPILNCDNIVLIKNMFSLNCLFTSIKSFEFVAKCDCTLTQSKLELRKIAEFETQIKLHFLADISLINKTITIIGKHDVTKITRSKKIFVVKENPPFNTKLHLKVGNGIVGGGGEISGNKLSCDSLKKTLTFTCASSSFVDISMYYIYSPNKKYFYENKTVIENLEAHSEYIGVWSCFSKNAYGYSETSFFNLNFYDAPCYSTIKVNAAYSFGNYHYVYEHSSVLIDCEAFAFPENIIYYVEKLTNNSDYVPLKKSKSGKFVFETADKSFSGVYRCVSVNHVNKTSSEIIYILILKNTSKKNKRLLLVYILAVLNIFLIVIFATLHLKKNTEKVIQK